MNITTGTVSIPPSPKVRGKLIMYNFPTGKYIFFDLDDTLYDRSEPFIQTFKQIFHDKTELSLPAYHACAKRGDEVFLPAQNGKITMEEMYIYRYKKGFADINITISPEEALHFQNIYSFNKKHIHLAPGIEDYLSACKLRYNEIGIITNGPSENQRKKLSYLPLDEYINPSLIFISGELDIAKPDPEIFMIAARTCLSLQTDSNEYDPNDFIFVGDTFSKDIVPPAKLGWTTIWCNRNHEPVPPSNVKPNFIW